MFRYLNINEESTTTCDCITLFTFTFTFTAGIPVSSASRSMAMPGFLQWMMEGVCTWWFHLFAQPIRKSRCEREYVLDHIPKSARLAAFVSRCLLHLQHPKLQAYLHRTATAYEYSEENNPVIQCRFQEHSDVGSGGTNILNMVLPRATAVRCPCALTHAPLHASSTALRPAYFSRAKQGSSTSHKHS